MTNARKRIRKLSTAVFRGSRSEYRFDVYPITTGITDNPAVFIFSHRIVDKLGGGHHAVSCVGETQSIVSEIKKHKRAKCIKCNGANVVCILKEADGKARGEVLDDIAAARTFSCVRGIFKPTINAKSDAVKKPKTAKILEFRSAAGAARLRAVHAPEPGIAKRKNGKPAKTVEPAGRSKPSKKTKNGKASASGKRVPGRVDSDGGQHRLSKPKKPATSSAKARVAGGARSRAKLAA